MLDQWILVVQADREISRAQERFLCGRRCSDEDADELEAELEVQSGLLMNLGEVYERVTENAFEMVGELEVEDLDEEDEALFDDDEYYDM